MFKTSISQITRHYSKLKNFQISYFLSFGDYVDDAHLIRMKKCKPEIQNELKLRSRRFL
jgi:hypothetical protein